MLLYFVVLWIKKTFYSLPKLYLKLYYFWFLDVYYSDHLINIFFYFKQFKKFKYIKADIEKTKVQTIKKSKLNAKDYATRS